MALQFQGLLPKRQVRDVLGSADIFPDIGVERGGRHSLKDGPAHPDYLKPNFFLAARVFKPCERRKFS